jgi:iron complex outermembrane receptor protein
MLEAPKNRGNLQSRICASVLMASTILAGTSLAYAAEVDQTGGLEEIVVTAQKRSENMQKVPISIVALGSEKLQELGVANFNDFAQYLPSVSFQSYAPGVTTVYMRGVASGENNNHSGPLPSVGTYLDEQPVTTIGGTLDVHIYDIARVEALAGPQGTLYGASSQAGTLRIITNKPDTKEFHAGYDVGVNKVEHGGVGYSGEGFVNLPISEKAAIRLVGWYTKDAGFIDNKPATLFYPNSDITINNASLAKNNYNDVKTYGGRAALKLNLDENWTITPMIMGQDQKQNGIFAFDPNAGDLAVTHFRPENSHDRWLQATLTVEGKIGNLDLTYAGGYMKRKINTHSDYSDYTAYYDNYDFAGGTHYYTAYDNAGHIIDPTQSITGEDVFTKQNHELRLQSDKSNRLRFTIGAFYQRQTHDILQRYVVAGVSDAQAVTGQPDTWWLTKQFRVDRDYAAFGSVSFDVTDQLTATAGIRYFKYDNSLSGFFGLKSFESQCFAPSPNFSQYPCTNLDKDTTGKNYTYNFNLSYKIDDKKMVYATISNGFRPGGINRRGGLPPYTPDWVTNYEVGFKTQLADNRLRFNGAFYWLDWKNMQFSYLGANSLTQIANAGSARVKGVETEITWAVDDHFTLSGAASYTDATLRNDYCKYANPTFDCTIPDPSTGKANSLKAPKGTQLPITPKFKMNMTARYEFTVNDFNSHVQASVVNVGSAWPALRTSDNALLGKQSSYTLLDLTAGIGRDNWKLDFFVKNLFDKRADMFRYSECGSCTTVYHGTNQPRTYSVTFGQKF